MDLFLATRAAEVAGIHITALSCAGTIADAGAGWQTDPEAQHNTNLDGDAETHRETDARVNASANTKADTDSHTNNGSNANTDSLATSVQSRLRGRDGERGVDQPDR